MSVPQSSRCDALTASMRSPSSPATPRSIQRWRKSASNSTSSTSSFQSSPRRWTPSSIRRSPPRSRSAGGLAVLNLEGVHTRYDDAAGVLEEIAAASTAEYDGNHAASVRCADTARARRRSSSRE